MTQHGMIRTLNKTSDLLREISFNKLYVPRKELFPIPLKYIDVTRNTHTPLDVMLEKILMITGTWMEIENCQTRGQVSQDLLY